MKSTRRPSTQATTAAGDGRQPAKGGLWSADLQASPRQVAQRAQMVQLFDDGVVQRLVDDEIEQVEIFFSKEILAIGSPTSKKALDLRRRALAARDVDTAKELIREHVRAWHAAVNDEVPDDDEPDDTVTDDRYVARTAKTPLHPSDLDDVLGPHQRPRLPGEPRDPRNRPGWLRNVNYTSLNATDTSTKLHLTSEVSSQHEVTGYELEKRSNTQRLHKMGLLDHIDRLAAIVAQDPGFAAKIQSNPSLSIGGMVGVYYRYHKFGEGDDSGLVFGGGFNKSDIDSYLLPPLLPGKLHGKALTTHFNKRKRALTTLGSGTPAEKARTLENAQANALDTPFIATSSNKGYPQDLLSEYPPSHGQYAVMLTILGPSMNTLDFEKEFEELKQGTEENNHRSTPERAKDKHQAEFGIPDIYIPIGKRSPLGFVIAHVERLT